MHTSYLHKIVKSESDLAHIFLSDVFFRNSITTSFPRNGKMGAFKKRPCGRLLHFGKGFAIVVQMRQECLASVDCLGVFKVGQKVCPVEVLL